MLQSILIMVEIDILLCAILKLPVNDSLFRVAPMLATGVMDVVEQKHIQHGLGI